MASPEMFSGKRCSLEGYHVYLIFVCLQVLRLATLYEKFVSPIVDSSEVTPKYGATQWVSTAT